MGLAITSSYEDVEKLIYQTVWRYQKIHGGDFQELLSDAHLHWVPAHGTFDPNRSRWSTYTSYKVWRGMQEELRTRLRKNRLICCQEQDLNLIDNKCTENPLFDLSEDAKTITDLIEDVDASVDKMVGLGIPGAEAKEACKAINPNGNNYDVIHEITSKLLGWQGLRFVNAMHEIRRKLSGEMEMDEGRKKRQEVIEMLAPFARGWPLPIADNLTPREAKIFDALMDLGCLMRSGTEHYLITNVGYAMLSCYREENLERDQK